MNGFISVIIPTYKRPEMLRQAIESVKSQDYAHIEIIVVDDCSGDSTENVLLQFPEVHYYINDTNRGPGYSRKLAFKKSRGEYIVFLDDDDYYTDTSFFSKAVAALFDHEDYIFVSANAKTLDVQTGEFAQNLLNVHGEMDAVEYLRGFAYKYEKPLSTFTTVFRRKVLEAGGLLDMEMVNDMAIYMRSLIGGKAFFADDVIGVYRVHSANLSKKITVDFLLENMKEKLVILNRIRDTKMFAEYNLWWLEQIQLTVGYYVYGSRPGLKELKRIQRWCVVNSENGPDVERLFEPYYAYLIDCKISAVKQKIKKVLGLI